MTATDWRHRPFWTQVQITDGCWLYEGNRNEQGYGILTPIQRKRTGERRAHRHAYVLFHGPIPDGLQINHHCDIPNCVRPDHIYAGTAQDNMDDRSRRGRANPRKVDVCPRGHEKSRDRTDVNSRKCVECGRIAAREWYRRKHNLPREKQRV
jgi:ferredoxin-like protein FixX